MDAADGELFVREVGTGATVLLIHGTGCDSDFWEPIVESLGRYAGRVLAAETVADVFEG